MSLPKHLQNVDITKAEKDQRIAVAPYNFVELPEKIVEVDLSSLPERDRYHDDRLTGYINCTLTTSSPLYVRCGMSSEVFEKYSEFREPCPELPEAATHEQRKKWERQKKEWQKRREIWDKERKEVVAPFFHTLIKSDNGELLPVIPGSSLRGMLRTIVEIISYSKISQVSEQPRFFFRDVVGDSKDEPLAKEYKKFINKEHVKAGYLVKQQGKWFIRSAKTIEYKTRKLPLVWIRESTVADAISNFISVDNQNYQPQYFYNVSFGDIFENKQQFFAREISQRGDEYTFCGTLLSSGNMLESNDGRAQSPRKNHCLVREPDANAQLIEISDDAIQHYRQALTDFQKSAPFTKEWGVLAPGRCIFYCEPAQKGEKIVFFGQSPNFRIPYSRNRDGKAASAIDFIPEHLRNSEKLDFAEALFGFVQRDRRKSDDSLQALAGRVFVSDALCDRPVNDDIWYAGDLSKLLVPKILSGPKPTTFQHYLVQHSEAEIELKHYASQLGTETVIRGHKLYWHQGKSPTIRHPDPDNAPQTQTTQIKPIKAGVSFQFKINFENLSQVELGALLWVLDIAQDDAYRLSLGMGKPLGMGAVKIESTLVISNRKTRYENLFNSSNSWEIGEQAVTVASYMKQFKKHMTEELKAPCDFRQICRIQSLLTMLEWQEQISPDDRNKYRYMEIERSVREIHKIGKPAKESDPTLNEYKKRPVLPTPLQVAGKPPCNESGFAVDQVLTVTVMNIKGKEITCQFPGEIKRTTKDKKRASSLSSGQSVQVQITELDDEGRPKKFKLITM